MKYSKLLIFILLCISALMPSCSCSHDEESDVETDIIGSWTHTVIADGETEQMTYTFNEDGSGSMTTTTSVGSERYQFNWMIENGRLYTAIYKNGEKRTVDYTIVELSDNMLILRTYSQELQADMVLYRQNN